MGAEHEFILILDGISDLSDEAVDALYEAGCDDSTIVTRAGRVMMGFTRSAPSRMVAIVSAILDIEKANVGAQVRVEPETTDADATQDPLAGTINSALALKYKIDNDPEFAPMYTLFQAAGGVR